MRISDWSSDVCSSDLHAPVAWFSIRLRRYATRREPALPRRKDEPVTRRAIDRSCHLRPNQNRSLRRPQPRLPPLTTPAACDCSVYTEFSSAGKDFSIAFIKETAFNDLKRP